MRKLEARDQIGIGWRPELAVSILSNLDQIDVVEVIIDDYFHAPKKKLRSLATLARQIPVLYHGVTLGLASSHPVDEKRLNLLARTLGHLNAERWSEHLAFVRAGGREIGHLAAPPRNEWTIEGAYKNLQRIEKVVGSKPILENIATLIDPPGSTMTEGDWVSQIASLASCDSLLDLHNLYSNALNLGLKPLEYLRTFPLRRVRMVHLSGGKWIPEPKRIENAGGWRLLDDHIHDVPMDVFELLKILASEVSQPLTVILERDGDYPEFQILLDQLRAARMAVAEGRRLQQIQREVGFERASL